MIDWTEIPDGETWELFSREVLEAKGFHVEVGVGRGSDAGCDLLVTEQLGGIIHRQRFRWLVSCKHYAKTGKAIGTNIESDILDRVSQHEADGFIGFYSTVPSQSLVNRLRALKQQGNLSAYEIFDSRILEGYFISTGLSNIAFRYFPASYASVRPIQQIFDEPLEVKCDVCGKDWLTASMTEPNLGVLVWAVPMNNHSHYEQLFVACKGECDGALQETLRRKRYMTKWEDIGDLCNPLTFLYNLITYTNMLHSRDETFSDQAHARMKHVYIAFAQRVLREVNKEDRDAFLTLKQVEGL